MRFRRRAFMATAAVLSGSALLMAFVLVTAPPERSEDPSLAFGRASRALTKARAAGAEASAPANLRVADEAYAEGMVERRRQELRPPLFRDYRDAHAAFALAVERGGAASEIAKRHADRARASASRSIEQTLSTLAALQGIENEVWIAESLRRRLQEARSLANQAELLLSNGAHDRADRRALEAWSKAIQVSDALVGHTARYANADKIATWSEWADETVAWSARTGKAAIVVAKDEHRLTLYVDGRVARTYNAELGWNNAADKYSQGDGATPEGRYFITQKKGRGSSRYYKALLLDYPNRDDIRALDQLKRAGAVSRNARAGGLIEIHGEGGRGKDWTDGCVAVSNTEMDELFAKVAVGTPVTIIGSRSGEGVFASVARRLSQ
jgi:lipoprotein-anchoring transpeptidase ErfK/SrfK